jgi:PKD repeat protein
MKPTYIARLLFIFAGIFSGISIAQAQVSFTSNTTTGCRPLPVSFTSSAPGSGDSYLWSFGDGSPNSTLKNPSHTFLHAGSYDVTLSVNGPTGGFLGNYNEWIYVNGATDSLNIPSHQVCPNDQVSVCLNMYNSNINSVAWNFGDGYLTTNTYNCIQHAYAAVGTYTITSIVKDGCGTDTSYAVVHVTSNAQFTNTPYFSMQSDSICPNDPATFYTDWGYQNYALDFGDGNTLTHTPSPNGNNTQINHTYASTGNYPAQITYFNSCGNSVTVRDTVHIVTHHQVTGYLSIDVN